MKDPKTGEFLNTTFLPHEFMVLFQDMSPGYWVPGMINYNGSPYMLVGDSLEEIFQSWIDENNIDSVGPDEFRVFNTRYDTLYRLNDDHTGFVEINRDDPLEGADRNWFDLR